MKDHPVSRGARADSEARSLSSTSGLDLLEYEITGSSEKTTRLEEVEWSVELQITADRILAIPLPEDP
jgi:hypothetical protein